MTKSRVDCYIAVNPLILLRHIQTLTASISPSHERSDEQIDQTWRTLCKFQTSSRIEYIFVGFNLRFFFMWHTHHLTTHAQSQADTAPIAGFELCFRLVVACCKHAI